MAQRIFSLFGHFINSYMTTLDIIMFGKIKVPERFDLVKTNGNNRLIFKLNVYHWSHAQVIEFNS